MKEIPLLLVGHILRRVEVSAIHIWLATSGPSQMNGMLYTISKNNKEALKITRAKTETTYNNFSI